MSRETPKKPTLTLRNGITLTLERVGPMYAMPITRANPPPDPPLAPGVGGEMEPNPSDPDYLKALETHREFLTMLTQDAYMDAAISDDLEIDHAAVARLRAKAAKYGGVLEDDDRLCYIKYCVFSDFDEITRFYEAMADYDGVHEEDVRAAEAMFQRSGTGEPDRGRDEVAAQEPSPV